MVEEDATGVTSLREIIYIKKMYFSTVLFLEKMYICMSKFLEKM